MSRTEKKRYETVNIQIDESHLKDGQNVLNIDLVFDQINDRMAVLDSETKEEILFDRVSVERGYFRGEPGREFLKPKVLSKIPLDSSKSHSINFFKNIEKYKYIFGIDTNLVTIKGKKYYLGVAHQLLRTIENGGITFHNLLMEPFFFLDSNVGKPENENWYRFISALAETEEIKGCRVAIVVDSDLGNIDSYNSRELPYFMDKFLPLNFELVFSSDAAIDSPLNKLIRACHRLSKEAEEFINSKH